MIHDVDDWFWGLDPANRAHKHTSVANDPTHNREHYRAPSPPRTPSRCPPAFLAKRIKERMGVKTVLIRNGIDRSMYATQIPTDATSGLVVGWTGALAWRSGDLETLRPFLPTFLKDTRSTFVHHGVFPDDRDTAADRIRLPADLVGPSKPAVHPLEYPDNVAGFDIGIVPLADVPFNHAKSWIKGLEYAAARYPVRGRGHRGVSGVGLRADRENPGSVAGRAGPVDRPGRADRAVETGAWKWPLRMTSRTAGWTGRTPTPPSLDADFARHTYKAGFVPTLAQDK